MNKIYKIKYSHIVNNYIVVSELAKGGGKKSTINQSGAKSATSLTLRKWAVKTLPFVISLVLSAPTFAANFINVTDGTVGRGVNRPSDKILLETNGGSDSSWISLGVNTSRSTGGQSSRDGIQIGNRSYIASWENIALGTYARAEGSGAIAIGSAVTGAQATKAGRDSIALGLFADASESWKSVVIGNAVKVKGERNIVLGSGPDWNKQMNVEGSDNISIGARNTIRSGAVTRRGNHAAGNATYSLTRGSTGNLMLGAGNTIKANSTDNVILGSNNTLSANSQNIILLGSNIPEASANNSIYIGSYSTAKLTSGATTANNATTKTAGESSYHGTVIDGSWVQYAGPGVAGNGVVSVGTVGKERRIQNVAAGLVDPLSTDAVNGSQLFAITKASSLWVYTDTAGKEVFQAKNGNWYYRYKADGTEVTFGTNGNPDGATQLAAGTEIVASIKNSSGSGNSKTQTPFKLNNIKSSVVKADGTAATIGDGLAEGSETNEFIKTLRDIATNVEDNAATVGDLKNIANSPIAFKGNDDGSEIKKKLGDTLIFTSEDQSLAGQAYSGSNIIVTSLDNKINVALKEVNSGADLADNSKDGVVTATAVRDYVKAKSVKWFNVNANKPADAQLNDSNYDEEHSGAKGADSIAIGNQAISESRDGIAIGHTAKAFGEGTIAIGTNIKSNSANLSAETNTAINAIVIGSGAGSQAGASANDEAIPQALGASSVAIGQNAYASQLGATALGWSAAATANAAQAFGVNASASGNSSIAIGFRATASGVSAMAIGRGANASVANSVALGSNSSTESAVATASVNDIEGLNYGTFAGVSPTGTVSVGRTGAERTVTNVAAGRITATSTDAINGSQLYDTNKKLGKLATAVKDNFGGNAALNADTGEVTFTNIGDTNKGTIHEAIKAVKEVVEGTAGEVVVTPDSTATDGHTKYTVSLDSTLKDKINNAADKNLSNLENTGKDVITGLVNAQAEGNYTTVTTEGGSGGNAKTFKISVNTAESISNTDSANNNKVASAAAVKSAVVNAKTKVSVNNAGILTINKTESEDLTANNYTLDVNVTKLKETLNDTYAAKSLENNTLKLSGDENSNTNTQALNKSGGLSFAIVGANSDITTTASGSQVSLSLNKATAVTQDDSKAVTSGAVYSAIAAAKPTVTKSGDYITITGTKSGGINGDTFTVGLDKDRLTQDLANNFSKTDGAEVD